MPAPYLSPLLALEALYDGLTAANFTGGVRPPRYFNEAPIIGRTGVRQSPPYVLLFDETDDIQWTFHSQGDSKGQNGIVSGQYRFEAYAFDLGDAETAMNCILWNGQIPDNRAGIAFANLSLKTPLKGIDEWVMPTTSQSGYFGVQYNNERVHAVKQRFKLMYSIVGTGY